jgi:hemerythrin-like domain-containing protein
VSLARGGDRRAAIAVPRAVWRLPSAERAAQGAPPPGHQEFTMPNAQRESARTATAARTEVLNMLKQDHKKVKKAFQDFERLDKRKQGDECQALAMQTCADLTVHTTLEEEIFYPAIRAAMREQGLIDEAEVEHASAKTLIADLQQLPPEDRAYAATFKVLGEYVQHHIKEEESEIFPQLTRAKLDWDDLRQQMMARRESLEAELQQDEQSRPMPDHEPQGRTVMEGSEDE